MKRILVACGNGIATSTVVATKIREKCEDNGIPVSVTQCKLLEVESKADDFDLAHKKHEEMGCICFENPEMGIYFIEDPDGYWLEILP